MNKKVLVTGSSSMIGRCVVDILKEKEYDVYGLTHQHHSLLDTNGTHNIFLSSNPDIVIHIAGHNGSLKYNASNPADIYYKTTMMGLNVINSSVKTKAEKIVFIIPSCALHPSKDESVENDLYVNQPHPSVECHGLSKRSVEAYGRQCEKQYGIKFVSCIGNNSFGPYDHYDERGKVVSGMIKRFVNAKIKNLPSVTCYGTGNPTREFIYCKDLANGLVQVMENYNEVEPINITSDFEISIKDLAHLTAKIVGYEGEILFDNGQDGQMRKKMSSSKMHKYLDIKITPFEEALSETIDWYINHTQGKNV